MNNSKILTNISILVGMIGILVKSYAWWSAWQSGQLGPQEWFMDAIVLMLVAIWLKLGAIYHKNN